VVMCIVDFVYRLMVAVCEDSGFAFMRIHATETRFLRFSGLELLCEVLKHRVEVVFLQGAGTSYTMSTATNVGFCSLVSMLLGRPTRNMLTLFCVRLAMGAILLSMRLVMALAFDVLRASLAKATAVVALGHGSAFLVDMNKRAV